MSNSAITSSNTSNFAKFLLYGLAVGTVIGTTYYLLKSTKDQQSACAKKKSKKKKKKKSTSSPDASSPVPSEPVELKSTPTELTDSKGPITEPEIRDLPKETSTLEKDSAHLFVSDEAIHALSKEVRSQAALESKEFGNKFFTSNRYDKAKEYYSLAIKYNPNPVYYSNRAACHSILKNYELVIEDCTSALTLDPKYVKALTRRGNAFEALGKLNDALNDYTAVCVLEEFKNESSLAATDRYLKKIATKKTDDIMELKDSTRTLPSPTFIKAYMDSFGQTRCGLNQIMEMPVSEQGDEKVKEIFELISLKQWETCLETCQSVLKNEFGPLSSTFEALALNIRATFYFLLGDLDQALVDIEKSLELDPKNVNSIIKLATLHMEKAQVEKAVGFFDDAEKLDSNDPDLYYHRGQIRFLVGDFPGAIQDYKKSVNIDPTCVYGYIQLGVAQYKAGENEKSKRTFEQAIKKFPDAYEVYNYYAEILIDSGKSNLALEYLEKAIELEPSSPLAYINRAILQLQGNNNPEAAEQDCRKAVQVDPQSDIAMTQLAQLLCHQNKIQEAIELYDKAINVTRTKQEVLNIVSCREAALAQLFVVENYPNEIAKLKPT